MNRAEREQLVAQMIEVLNRHRTELHRIPGCTGAAVGLKQTRGEPTETLAITVFVASKHTDVPNADRVPRSIEGYPTDVVERAPMSAVLLATDPFARHDPVFGGISVTPYEAPGAWGSIGCFLNTTGDPGNGVEPGDYLLTCQHVLKRATPEEPLVIQPKVEVSMPPANTVCGTYVKGYLSETADCAIVRLTARTFENTVPNYPWHPGRRTIAGVGVATPGELVYKYGATSKFTEGIVVAVGYSAPRSRYRDIVLISTTGDENTVWVATGDSGSVTLRQDDDFAIALNFVGDGDAIISPPPRLPALPAFSRGFSYDLQSQFDLFAAAGGVVVLAEKPPGTTK